MPSLTVPVAPASRLRTPWVRRLRRLWEASNESYLRIQTACRHSPDTAAATTEVIPSRYADGVAYETPDYYYLRKIRRHLFPTPAPDEVLYDLGCGRGRILCVMARARLRAVVGIELQSDLYHACHNNLTNLRGRKSPFDIRQQDAALANLDEATVIFLFNAFGEQTLTQVCHNLRDSLARTPRSLRFVYYNDLHADVLSRHSDLTPYHTFTTWNGLRVSFWSNIADNQKTSIRAHNSGDVSGGIA